MKKRLIALAILAVCLLLLGWWILHGIARQGTPFIVDHSVIRSLDTNSSVSNRMPASSFTNVVTKIVQLETPLGFRSVRLFKSTNYPPQTAEEKAMWEWWDTMDKADSDFQWKMPIEFYGKVIDQFGQPVERAKVVLNWTTVIGRVPDPKKTIFTDLNGCFELRGIQGKVLLVDVSKEGYDFNEKSQGDFEYAAFYRENFHVPDPNNPVIFRLQKLMGAEPMYKYLSYGEIPLGGGRLVYNVEKGRITEPGDLALSVVVGESNRYGLDFTVTIQGLNGAGCAFSREEFLFKAPETEYRTMLTADHKPTASNYDPSEILRFYVRTGTGKYAAIDAKVSLLGDMSGANLRLIVYYNPSGSRNLEFDQNKWINR
jgi:hypothetical protein